MALNLKPTHKQAQAYLYLTDSLTNILLFGGGANGGKSWLGCEWLLSMALEYDGTRYFIGRDELKNLRGTTLITFFKVAKWHAKTGLFTYNGQDHYINFKNGSRIDLLELKYYPSDPLYERYGSAEYTSGWIEEGGEVNFGAFDTLKSRIGRCNNDQYGIKPKLLVTCNPKKNWLYNTIWKQWRENRLPRATRFVQSLIDDNPYRESGSKEQLESITDKVKKQRLLKGEWEYDNDPSCLMDGDDIRDCFTNGFVESGEKYITADIARFGKDNTILMIWAGLRVEKIESYNGLSVTESATKIKEMSNKYQVGLSNIIVDEDGIGGGVKDILNCKGFVNNSSPLEVNYETDNFDNLKSQCEFKLADYVNKHLVFINCSSPAIQEAIIEEMEQIKKKNPDADKKNAVVPKEERKKMLGRSPDYSDAIMMRMFFELQPNATVTADFIF